MLRRNIDTRCGLVNGALGTVTAIRTHHVTVQFDGRRQPYQVERVKGRFLVLKNIYVQRKQFPLILAFSVTVHNCQGLSLDCAVMDLSKQVICAGMAYVALPRVKQMQNLHLIAFDVEEIKVSGKGLEELNRLRQTYRPDLPLYAVPPSPMKQRKSRKRKNDVNSAQPPPTKVTASRQPRPRFCQVNLLLTRKGHFTLQQNNCQRERVKERHSPPTEVQPDWQHQACQQLGLRFVSDNW